MKLNNKIVLEKIREYFMNPTGIPDLPSYIVATWKIREREYFKTALDVEKEEITHGAISTHGEIFKMSEIGDVRHLYFLLVNPEIEDLRLYQITPTQIVLLLSNAGVNV